MGRVQDYIRKMVFGFDVEAVENAVGLGAGAVPVQIVQANSNRVALIVANPGAGIGYVGLTSGVSATNGIPIPIGNSVQFTAQDLGEYVSRQLFGFATAATTLYIVEIRSV